MSDPAPAPVTASPLPPALSLAARLARASVVAALALALGFFVLLALVATAPLVRDAMKPLVSDHKIASIMAAVIVIVVVVTVPMILLVRLARRRVLRWPQLTVLSVLVIGGFVYLVWDDPAVRRPLTMDELAPTLPGDEVTHTLILRYGKDAPATKAYRSPKISILVNPKEAEKWAKHLRDNRAEIEAGWANLSTVREWWDELATHPRLGDLTPPRVDAPILAFQPVRHYSQYAASIAGLKALDGQGDEAADILLRLYDVARKFEPNSRTLVRSMISKVMQRMAIETTGFVLDRATVSPAKRAALAQSLSSAAGGPAGVRRLVLIEYAYFQPFLSFYLSSTKDPILFGDRWMHQVISRLSRVLVNPRATQNLVGERYYQMAADAEERRLTEFEANSKAIERQMENYHIKNLGGRMFADMAMPAYGKIVKTYWDTEDMRTAMIARLKS